MSSTKLRQIARCAENAIKKVPTLPPGNPGKREFGALVQDLHAAADFECWYSEKDDYDETRDTNKTVYSGSFVSFVSEATRQLKRFLHDAPVQCWPSGIEVSTDTITEDEVRALGRAIKAVRQCSRQVFLKVGPQNRE